METGIIHTQDLTKEYGDFTAVKGLNLHIHEGEIYGFLGPNGAGKTTTILMLLGIVKPTRGKVFLFGKELWADYFAIKRRIGVTSEQQYMYNDMTAYEYLSFFADLYRVKDKARRIRELLEAVELYEWKDVRTGDFSRGMRQKLGFVRALLHDPDLLILDEPVSGLDPYGIRQIRNLILEQNRRGKAVLISSHVLSEIEQTAHRVGIIHHGELLAQDNIENLRRKLGQEVELEVELQAVEQGIVKALSALPFVRGVSCLDNRLNIRMDARGDFRAQISQTISAQGGIILSMKAKEMSLEETFITITEKNIHLLTED